MTTQTASDVLATCDDHGIDLPDFGDRAHPTDLADGMTLATCDDPRHAELVVVQDVQPRSGGSGAWDVTVTFPERDAVDGGDYEYTTTFASLVARSEADGGWVEVPPTVTTGTATCPSCGSFLSVHDARAPFDDVSVYEPTARGGCDRCGTAVGHGYLTDAGVAIELLI